MLCVEQNGDQGADLLFIYVTTPNREAAMKIAHDVIGEKLAACANVLGPIASVFFWENVVREEGEVALILKTTRAHYSALESRIRALHPYETPCIVAWPVPMGNVAYVDWIQKTVGDTCLRK